MEVPVIGVAKSGWTLDQLKGRARASIDEHGAGVNEAVFARLSADQQRLSPQPERFDELQQTLFALYAIAPNFPDDELRAITTPTLVLDGAEEELILPGEPERQAALIPGSRLVIMPGTGHFAPFEQPEEFNRIVLAFLAA